MVFAGGSLAVGQPVAPAPVGEALLRAYPDTLAGVVGDVLVWRDGTRMSLTAGPPAPTPGEGSIMDMFLDRYPPGTPPASSVPDDDPGRTRNGIFFEKMYGNCRRGEVTGHLVPLVWLPATWGHTIRATSVNGVADKLAAVSREIDALDPETKRAAYPIGGTYACRDVADTGNPSMHGAGAAIDLNVSQSDYWLWRRGAPYRNRIPLAIVEIFERHGFIWGGKWSHYDTMHFEYRPELLEFAKEAP
ncbi:MAG: M15 family metallopeptidase [Acetobacteraceae bacterium]|nr:M15 family metallopeptidase [Acetobacteraceae bacterium]